jgi:hypothetical protein
MKMNGDGDEDLGRFRRRWRCAPAMPMSERPRVVALVAACMRA